MKENLQIFTLVFFQQDTAHNFNADSSFFRLVGQGISDSAAATDSTLTDTMGLSHSMPAELVPSILENHALKPGKIAPETKPYGNEDWITVHFLLALAIYAWIRLFYFKRLKQAFKAFMGNRFQGMLVREGNILRERISIALMIIYLISTSLLFYLLFTRILNSEMLQLKSFKLFSFIMLVVIVLWILKNMANTIIGRVFQNPVIISEYLLTNFIFNITVGTILFPILILAVYLPSVEMIYVGLGVWVISFIYRLIRLLFTSLSFTKFSLFNRILYLCTFELSPVFILIKLVMSNLGY